MTIQSDQFESRIVKPSGEVLRRAQLTVCREALTTSTPVAIATETLLMLGIHPKAPPE